jgi:hypothetical protein
MYICINKLFIITEIRLDTTVVGDDNDSAAGDYKI